MRVFCLAGGKLASSSKLKASIGINDTGVYAQAATLLIEMSTD